MIQVPRNVVLLRHGSVDGFLEIALLLFDAQDELVLLLQSRLHRLQLGLSLLVLFLLAVELLLEDFAPRFQVLQAHLALRSGVERLAARRGLRRRSSLRFLARPRSLAILQICTTPSRLLSLLRCLELSLLELLELPAPRLERGLLARVHSLVAEPRMAPLLT